jgi:hypothetical protein
MAGGTTPLEANDKWKRIQMRKSVGPPTEAFGAALWIFGGRDSLSPWGCLEMSIKQKNNETIVCVVQHEGSQLMGVGGEHLHLDLDVGLK